MSPDFIYKPYDDQNKGYISDKNLENIIINAEKSDVILLGCGIGQNLETLAFVKAFLEAINDIEVPLIIDADGLNCLSKLESIKLPLNTVLTPHPLELARLLKVELNEILTNRIDTALIAAERFGATIVSKGLRTIIADKEGNIFVSPTGNNALAKAGTGDVLAGMIAGFAAQTQDVLTASLLGVFLHGLAGDIYRKENCEYSLTASELINYIPDSIMSILENTIV
jgi:NAD(P)H-hydrate epimerase